MQKKEHLYVVDICRFGAILMIMAHHRYILGFEGDYIFRSGWAWVEYFFMITGFLTIKHFKQQPVEKKECGQTAFIYTVRKFKAFMAYVVIAVLLQYIVEGFHYIREGHLESFLSSFLDAPFEIGMLTTAGFTGGKVAPLWFLSAMFLTLPILICAMIKLQDIWMVISFLIPVLYYGKMGLNTERAWPNDILRGVAAMCLGMFLFYLSGYLKKIGWTCRRKALITLLEIGTFGAAVYVTAFNKECLNLLLILFSVNLCIMMSECSYTSLIQGKLWGFLGKISLPIFIFHWTVGTISLHFSSNLQIKLGIYYGMTIIVACVAVIVTEYLKKRKIQRGE